MEIVKFEDGTYGVMKKSFFGKPKFMSNGTEDWWTEPKYVNNWCKFKTRQEAIEASIIKYEILE